MAVGISILVTTACNIEKTVVNIDASMLLGRWVTIDAEEQCKWKPSIKNKLDSTDYIYTKMDVYESMIDG